jgi:hypothetical protein
MHDIRQLVLAVLCAFAPFVYAAAPATYLDYIESDGSSQYIDLGIEGRCNLEIEAELAFAKMPTDSSFIASRNSNTRFYPLHYYGGFFQLGYVNNTATSIRGMSGIKYTLNSKFTQGEQTMTVDGTLVARGTSSTAVATGFNLYLFACNYGGSPNFYIQGRLYTLKIWNLVDGERESLQAFSAWCDGADNEKDVRFWCRRHLEITGVETEILALHTDYSLCESLDRLAEEAPVFSRDFDKVLLDNASNGYCRSHQYEIAAGWYVPFAEAFVREVLRRVDAGERERISDEWATKTRQSGLDDLKAKGIEAYRPSSLRTADEYRRVLIAAHDASAKVFVVN